MIDIIQTFQNIIITIFSIKKHLKIIIYLGTQTFYLFFLILGNKVVL